MSQKELTIALVGRPNVGKSSLFNKICRRRISIVQEAEGVTRDRIYGKADHFGVPLRMIDSGGIDAKSSMAYAKEIERQSLIAIQEADVVIHVVDGRAGVTVQDEELTIRLRREKKPILLAVNKIDNFSQEALVGNFYSLGYENVIGVSAIQSYQIAELLDSAVELYNSFYSNSEEQTLAIDAPICKIALIGKPNAGKSTLMNYLLNEERCMVSPIANTTRDSIDADVIFNNQSYRFIDTAGLRHRNSTQEVVDKYAAIRTQEAIARADICLMLIDSVDGLSLQDKKIANLIESEGKSLILLFNKWDLIKGFRMEHCKQGAIQEIPFLAHSPILFISAKTGRNVEKIFTHIQELQAKASEKITTGKLNRFISKLLQKRHPTMIHGKRLRIYYMTQMSTNPPTFILFINSRQLIQTSYEKFLINELRKEFGLGGMQIRLILRAKDEQKSSKRRQKMEAITPLLARESVDEDDDSEAFDHMDFEEVGEMKEFDIEMLDED